MTSNTVKEPHKKTLTEEPDIEGPATWSEILPYFIPVVNILLGLYFEYYHNNFFMYLWQIYVIIPILDYTVPVDNYNPSEKRARLMEKDKRYLIPLYCVYFIDLFTTVWFLHRVSTGDIATTFGNMVYYAICLAHIGAMNSVVGHELLHRKFILHKIAGISSFGKMLYSHYYIQHVHSHHKMVATPFDASTSYLNESVFQFFGRTTL